MPDPSYLTGFVATSRAHLTDYGCVLTLMVARSADEARAGESRRVMIALSDQQILALARDLEVAAVARGMIITEPKSRWDRLLSRVFRR